MILTLNEFDNDRDCPELYNAFNTLPCDYQTGLEDASFTTLETMTDSPKDADDGEYYTPFQFGDSLEQCQREMALMTKDFETLAQHWGCSPDDVWQMWQNDQIDWEAPIAHAG
jgi:hypothetical protein